MIGSYYIKKLFWMKSINVEKLTKLSFISLALIPLLKENINSIFIIICAILTIISHFKSKEIKKISKDVLILTTPFWMFFFHEVFTSDFNFDRTLRYLPFLIFPFLFFIKPNYIDSQIKSTSIKVFQISVLSQCILYFLFFLNSHPLNLLFQVRNNIPVFREFVSENYFFEIHPTYFSSFLLISFTVSVITLITKRKHNKILDLLNSLVCLFFIFLFSSKIIFLIVLLTITAIIITVILKKSFKHGMLILFGVVLSLTVLTYPLRNVIGDRFIELKTEINKPIIGDYYNSTNTRIAIIKCSLKLLDEVPFFGFGDQLQSYLNKCYKDTNDSDFYLKQTFNTHNYYLNLILYGGYVFFTLFVFYLLFVFFRINYSLLTVVIFIQLILINFTENYFSRHYGIVLFTYFTSMFIFINDKRLTNS